VKKGKEWEGKGRFAKTCACGLGTGEGWCEEPDGEEPDGEEPDGEEPDGEVVNL
jgi:hypothetical protein